MHKECKCNKILLLHLSVFRVFVGCFASQYVCNFMHHCNNFQTGKINFCQK